MSEKMSVRQKIGWSIGILAAVVVVVGMTMCSINEKQAEAYRNELRNMATDTMELDFGNVYADVVTFEPEYTVKAENHGIVLTSQPTEVVCKCETVEGVTIWLAMPPDKYSSITSRLYSDAATRILNSYSLNDAHFDKPVRVNGRITTFGDIANNAPASQKDDFILDVENID